MSIGKKTIKILEFDKIIMKLSTFATCGLGKEFILNLLPETNYERVKELLKETDDGLSLILRKGHPPMGGISDIRDILKKVSKGSVLNPGEFLKVEGILKACRNLKRYASDMDNSNHNQTEKNNRSIILIKSLITNIKLEQKINSAIASEDEILDTASTTLRNIRRQISKIQYSLKERLDSFIHSNRYRKFMQDGIVTLRDGRYVIPVKQEYRNEVKGIVHDSSSSGVTLFIEPMAVVEANNEIKQLNAREETEIQRILAELTKNVSDILPGLESDISKLARLDFIFAKAKFSIEYRCVSPRLNKTMHLDIKKARHPLLDKNTVVPVDFRIGDGYSIIVITGPNTGGKTVALKTIGLFSLMLQSGLHIPAGEETDMCIFGKIFADIGDEQSIEQSLSTFSSHMTNIVEILYEVDDKSLVLLDELGAGTDPDEGAALAMAILDKLHDKGCIAAATTHYSELKMYALTTQDVINASCEFDVDTLKPTYRLLTGVPGKSNAFAISEKIGLTMEILKKAEQLLSRENIQFEDILRSMEKSRIRAEKERQMAEKYRYEMEKTKSEIEKEREKLNSRKDDIIRNAKKEARKILIDVKQETDEIIKKLKKTATEQPSSNRNKTVEELRKRLTTGTDKLEQSLEQVNIPRKNSMADLKKLKPGDSVRILNLNQKGMVLGIPDKSGEVLVQAGIMKISVHISNLEFVDEQKESISRLKTGDTISKVGKTIKTELDVRGRNLDEALLEVDKFLDDASIAGLHEVMIIHGKGMGILREGIQNFLKTNNHVISFRKGKYGEGETGVTVVEI